MQKVIISADSTCDLSRELIESYGIRIFSMYVMLEEQTYRDGVDITPDEIYRAYSERGKLPHTSAVNGEEYAKFFAPMVEEGYEVIHISLGSALSSTHQNCVLAAQGLNGVYVLDSKNLSTGMGLLVLEAAARAKAGMDAQSILRELEALVPLCRASFVLDDLTFLRAGGRCSALTALGANLLHIKPSIEVDCRQGGAMGVGKKYRGKMERVLQKYINDQLTGYTSYHRERVFITHSGTDEARIALMKELVEQTGLFDEVIVTRAGCTISAHCGPHTMGVLFIAE